MIYLAFILILLASPSWAKTLYVNNSGSPACSNDTTYANNDASNPWCLIGRAAWGSTNPNSPSASEAAAAGDVVLITAGTYTTDGVTSGGRFDVALNAANDGTVGNPITFRGVGTVNIRMTANHTGPTIGAKSRDYIIWDHITIDDTYCGSVSDSGPVVFWDSTGSQLINSTLQGHTGTLTYDDGHNTFANNYDLVRTESTNGIRIANNTISRVYNRNTGSRGSNQAGITMYDSVDAIIEHNEVFDAGNGIYIKGDDAGNPIVQSGTIVRFNRFHDNDRGMQVSAAYQAKIYQNIIKSNTVYGIRQDNFVSPRSEQVTIQNNVVAAHSNGTSIGYSADGGTSNIVNLRVFNNIFTGAFHEAVNIGTQAIPDSTFEHNIYNGYTTWGSYSGAQRSFATWTGTGKDSASPASVTSDPLFVNTTDYKLQGGSPALNLGVDILDLDGDTSTTDNVDAGAYITGSEVIGVEGAAAGTAGLSGSRSFFGSARIQ